MKRAYQDWIEEYRASVGGSTYGMCGAATKAMQLEFPELRLARGTVEDIRWGERTHWWCVTAGGEIIDPTRNQFPGFVEGSYKELVEGDPIPSGRCMDCGGTVYDGAQFCSATCEQATVDYLNDRTSP